MLRRTTPIALALTLAACMVRPDGYSDSRVEGVKIVPRTAIAAESAVDRPITIPFGEGEDGTRMILGVLEQAQALGAPWVTDIAITLRHLEDGEVMACTTWVGPEAEVHARTRQVYTPGRTEGRMELRPVTRTVTEYQYRCRMVRKPVTRYRTTYEYRYDYRSKSSRSVPVSKMVTEYQLQNECRNEPVTRTVTRYEYQYVSEWVPPRLDYITEHYTEWQLVESEPLCEPDPEARSAIHALAWVPADADQP